MKILLRKWNFFGVKEFFRMYFDFKNGWKNELKDNIKKSCGWSRNKDSHKIDFKAVWPRNGHAASMRVNIDIKNFEKKINKTRKWHGVWIKPKCFGLDIKT